MPASVVLGGMAIKSFVLPGKEISYRCDVALRQNSTKIDFRFYPANLVPDAPEYWEMPGQTWEGEYEYDGFLLREHGEFPEGKKEDVAKLISLVLRAVAIGAFDLRGPSRLYKERPSDDGITEIEPCKRLWVDPYDDDDEE